MHAVPQFPALPPQLVQHDTMDCWADIYTPAVNLVVWEREPPAAVRQFAAAVAAALPDLSIALSLGGPEWPAPGLDAGLERFPGYGEWQQEVEDWLAGFFCLFDARRVGLRLKVLDRAMCPRFHVDHVVVRLISSYGEPGTEWLANESVDRRQLGPRPAALGDIEAGLYTDERQVRGVPAWAVALMKGERWTGNEGRGLVHRSPVPGPARRLLLTLDLLD